MKATQIEKLNQLISRTDMTGNQKVDWLTSFIDEHVAEQLRLHDVSNRRELLIKFCDALFEQNGIQITNVQIDFLMRKFNL